ncbi:hypothetical protein CCACVL1_11515 [Corchorus capsularis]|uniref:Uncharacterized protein n=1 Tax=Corchorus capsularis TaxID=210143 RepID=A0A1R3IKT4_COCAP|nr:hypothetical protein CCACVL1_11515 [Corchorus capsularis]
MGKPVPVPAPAMGSGVRVTEILDFFNNQD